MRHRNVWRSLKNRLACSKKGEPYFVMNISVDHMMKSEPWSAAEQPRTSQDEESPIGLQWGNTFQKQINEIIGFSRSMKLGVAQVFPYSPSEITSGVNAVSSYGSFRGSFLAVATKKWSEKLFCFKRTQPSSRTRRAATENTTISECIMQSVYIW